MTTKIGNGHNANHVGNYAMSQLVNMQPSALAAFDANAGATQSAFQNVFTSNETVDVATATNETRLLKMILRYQAERFLAGEETTGGGDASSIPGLEEVKGVQWEALEREVQVLEG